MPDTGAPWNIPYVAPSDLVRDYPSDSEDLANAIADGLDEAGNAGIGSNVVHVRDDGTATTTSTSFADLGSLSVTITPSSSSSKVLLIADVVVTNNWTGSGQQAAVAVFDGGNTTTTSSSITTWGSGGAGNYYVGRDAPKRTMMFLDSPATTSAVTYKVQWRVTGGTGYYNENDGASAPTTQSSLIAIEVAA
jgi:hypothetical protein